MKCVIDTNVLVSVLIKPDGAASQLFRHVFHGTVTPVVGAKLLLEYEDVLGRDYIFTTSPLHAEERWEFLMALASRATWSNIHFQWRPNLRDEGDNHLVELAIASNAPYIITWNTKDFKGGELYFPQIATLTPQAFLTRLTQE